MSKPIIRAAGGLVWNEDNELLMIFRQDKWDLPKGKVDDGETLEACAIREVQEETGLKELQLGVFVGITQHEYFDKYLQKEVIKESHWFTMQAKSSEQLIPQTEEQITQIKWVPKESINTLLKNSYLNIELIIKHYFNNIELSLADSSS